MGSIYKKRYKDKETGDVKESNFYWIKYYWNGKAHRESTHTDLITKAQKLLKQREGESSKGQMPGYYFDKVTFDDLAKDFLTDYRVNVKDTIKKAERNITYLKKHFERVKAIHITTDKVKDYIDKRMQDGYANATINRELAALKRMFHLAAQCTPPKVSMIPYIPMLNEDNVRQGFFEHSEFLALRGALPSFLKPFITFGYHTGWRINEIRNLTWDKVDMTLGVVRLHGTETKNRKGREYYLAGELLEQFKSLDESKPDDCPYVFHREGNQIRDFRWHWDKACIAAGLCEVSTDEEGNEIKRPSKIFHDFRRTAIRNMTREGISESVAKKISGHKTDSVFKRYDIVSSQDIQDAAKRIEAYHRKQEDKGKVIQFPYSKAQNE
jgi:integrase